jgi:hypothetical protein
MDDTTLASSDFDFLHTTRFQYSALSSLIFAVSSPKGATFHGARHHPCSPPFHPAGKTNC